MSEPSENHPFKLGDKVVISGVRIRNPPWYRRLMFWMPQVRLSNVTDTKIEGVIVRLYRFSFAAQAEPGSPAEFPASIPTFPPAG